MHRVRLPAAMATMHSWHTRCGVPVPWQMRGVGSRHAATVAAAASRANRSKSAAAPTATPGPSNKVLLVDGLNIAFRTWAAMSQRPLTTSDGIPTTVAFGFIRTLGNAILAEQPRYACVVFDAPKGSASRKELHAAYKANRKPVVPSFTWDLKNARTLLQLLRVPMLQMPGYEADDVMAALTGLAVSQQLPVRLLSSDKDLWQLVDDSADVAALVPGGAPGSSSGGLALVDEAGVMERLQVPPSKVADFKALSGDSSDNLPGVPGIGPKTAAELLAKHGTLDGVFQHLEDNKPGVVKKLTGQEEVARTFRELVLLRPAAVPSIDWSLLQLPGFSIQDADPLIDRLQMPSMRKTLAKYQDAMGGAAAPSPELQELAYAAAEDNDRRLEQLIEQAALEQEAAPAAEADGGDGEGQQQQPEAASVSHMDAAADHPAGGNTGGSPAVPAAASGNAGGEAADTVRKRRRKQSQTSSAASAGADAAGAEPVAGNTAASKPKARAKKQQPSAPTAAAADAGAAAGGEGEGALNAAGAPTRARKRQPTAAAAAAAAAAAGADASGVAQQQAPPAEATAEQSGKRRSRRSKTSTVST